MPYVLIALTIAFRLVPHPFSFTPVGALGLFAGAYCSPKIAWLVPLIALAIGDMTTGAYDLTVMAFVYAGFVGGPLLGRHWLSTNRSARRFVGATFAAALVFFILSNFGNWLAFYPRTPAGLIECYINAIPFFGNQLAGDFTFGAVLFGSAEAITRYRHRHALTDDA